MSKLCTTLILVVGLVAISAQGSAIKGHHHQTQSVQRVEEQARVSSLKSAALQQPERSPKSAPVPVQSAAPILESSKKVYNDASFRRSVSQQQAGEQLQAVPSAKSAPAVVAEPAAPVQQSDVGQPQAPVVQSAPVVTVVSKEAAAPASVQQEPAEAAAKPAAESPVAKASEELPPQTARSAPVKEEAKPQTIAVDSSYPSPVVVEQVVPAKVPAAAAVEPVVAAVMPAQQQHLAPVVAEPKAAISEPQIQPAPVVAVQSQPEAVVEPMKPTMVESSLQAKKEEPAKESNEPIEVPAPDPGLVLSEPIDSTTKLLIDLDEHVQKFLPAEDKQEPVQPAKEAVLISGVDYSPPQAHAVDSQPSGKSSVPLVPYSSNVENEPIVPPLPSSLDKVEKATGAQSPQNPVASTTSGQSASRQANHQHQNQQQVITQLLDQLDSLQNRIQDTINQLVARRRYVMSALLRPMGTYVKRVRTNLERLQNRVNQLQAAASSVGGNNQNQRPGGFVDAAAIETIRRRIDDISKRISDIVNRIRFSLTPTSAPLNNNGRK